MAKTHLTVLHGRHGQYTAERRQKQTSYPRAGETVQPHIILLRVPAQKIIERKLAEGHEVKVVGGDLRVALKSPIYAIHYVEALVAAYATINRPREQIIEAITTQAFGEGKDKETERYVELLIEGADAEQAARDIGLKSPMKIGALCVLGETSKMGCYSFNLPAGPVFQEGTCPASQLGFMFQTDEELAAAQRAKSSADTIVVPDFICNGCYAIKGAYGNPSQVFAMQMRLAMTKVWLKAGTFSDVLVRAITTAREKSRRRLRAAPEADKWAIPHPDFFRIHDAGDMFSAEYAEAWFDVCRRMPDMHFWSPTRMWSVRRQASVAFARGIPDNLALRPSALHFGDKPPAVEYAGNPQAVMSEIEPVLGAPGLSAGSEAGREAHPGSWHCPAYAPPEQGGGGELDKRGRISGGTCARAHGPDSPFRGGDDKSHLPVQRGGHGCRACWTAKALPIFYHEH